MENNNPFNIQQGKEKEESEAAILKRQHADWKRYEMKGVKKYYILFDGIKPYLPLMGKASELYLFYCLVSRNETGESWYATDTLAKELNVSVRTINLWNSKLSQLGLIKRVNNETKTTHTFLLPTNDYISNVYDYIDTKEDNYLSKFLTKVISAQDTVWGDISPFSSIELFHIFQWRKTKEGDYSAPYNILVAAVLKEINSPVGDSNIHRHAFFTLQMSNECPDSIKIDKDSDDFNAKAYKFASPFVDNELASQQAFKSVNFKGTIGFAFDTKINIKKIITDSSSSELTDLLVQAVSEKESVVNSLVEVSSQMIGGDKNEVQEKNKA